jgi:hypothetical protein
MKIHEYQGKQLFKHYGVPVLRGIAVTTADQAEAAARELGSPIVVVKSQIHAGGRGKGTVYADEAMTTQVMAGGVKLAKSPAEAKELAGKLLGNYLKTIQTGDGCKQVQTLYIEDGCAIAKEAGFYIHDFQLAVSDGVHQNPVVVDSVQTNVRPKVQRWDFVFLADLVGFQEEFFVPEHFALRIEVADDLGQFQQLSNHLVEFFQFGCWVEVARDPVVFVRFGLAIE